MLSMLFGTKEGGRDETLSLQNIAQKEFYESLLDNDSSMILYFLEKKGWVGANKTFLNAMNYYDISDFLNIYESIRDMFIHESDKIFTESDKGWLDYLMKYKGNGYKVRMFNAKDELLVLNAKVQFDKKTNIYILKLEDITALEKERVKVKDAEKLKLKFLANIGYEFRTPMNSILGFMELLESTKLNKTQAEYFQMISYSAQNLMKNFETLLEFSELESGRLEVVEDDLNLVEEIEKITNSFFKEAKIKNVSLISFIDPKIPKFIKSDASKLMQIIYSIAHHAIELSKSGGTILIEIKLIKMNADGSCSIGFAFKDNGEGLSKEQIALIEKPFSVQPNASQRLRVGLSLSNGLIKLLGSDLKIHSEKDIGSYLSFVLNISASHDISYKSLKKKRVKVLLLDQNRLEEASNLVSYLKAFGFEVVKSNVITESLYTDVEAVYIVANQEKLSWVLDLAKLDKRHPIIMLLGSDEKLKLNLGTLVDKVLNLPLLPSRVAKHLDLFEKSYEEKKFNHSVVADEAVQVLVAEDNVINQKLIKILLEGYKIEVKTAMHGLEALQMCKQEHFDIVFMDIDMPYMNGIVATKKIKEYMNNTPLPIVALTAMTMQGDKEMLLSKGFDDYLPKPLTRDNLEHILEKYLKVKQIVPSV